MIVPKPWAKIRRSFHLDPGLCLMILYTSRRRREYQVQANMMISFQHIAWENTLFPRICKTEKLHSYVETLKLQLSVLQTGSELL